MRSVRIILLSLMLLLSSAGTGAAAGLSAITDWGGPWLLSLLQSRINGQVTAGEISGNPFTGITYKDLTVRDAAGRPVLAAARLEIRLSLWSIPTFHLELGNLALIKPQVYLSRAPSGRWNVLGLAKPAAPPAKTPGLLDQIAAYFLRRVDLPNLKVHHGELVITRDDLTRRYPDLDFSANLTLLDLGKPQQKVMVNLADLGITAPQGRVRLETRLTYSSGLAKLHRLDLQLAGRTVVSLQGEVCRPLSQLTCTLTGRIGPLAGAKLNGFWPRWPSPWDLSGVLSLSSTPAGGTLRLQGKIGQAVYTLQGDLKARRRPAVFNLDLDLKGLTTAQLQELKDLKAQSIKGLSPVNAHLHLEGAGLPWNPESLKTHLQLEPFRYRDLKVDKVRLDLSGNARHQELQASVAGNFGSVDLGAKGRLLPVGDPKMGLSGDLTLQTGNFQPALLGVAKLPGTSLNTCFIGKFRLPPGLSPARLFLAGDLTASGRLHGQPLQDLSAGFALDGNKLAISQADLRLAGLAASLQGTLTRSGVDVSFNASLAGSRALPLPPGAAFASLTAQGAVRGPWKAPRANLTGQVRKVSFKGLTLEAANLSGDLAGWPPQSGSLRFLGHRLHTPAGTFKQVRITAGGAGGAWQFQVAAASPQEPKFELTGTAHLAARPLVVSVTRLAWHSPTLAIRNQAPFQVSLAPGWEISPATLKINGGAVTIAGRARDQEVSGHLEIRDLNAALLAPLGLPASGKLNGRLTLAGRPRAPSLNGQIALSAGKLKTIPIQTLTTSLNYQDGQAQVSGFLEIGPLHSRLVWNGSVPVKISLIPFTWSLARDGLDLRLHSERVNLSLLTAVSKAVQTAQGSLDLVVEARGNPYQPQVSGHLRWRAGSVQLHDAGTPYRLLPGEIRLQGDKIVIPGLVIQSDGTLRLSGEIVLAGPPHAQARVQADNFQLLYRGGNELWTNGFINLQGPLSALVVEGHLQVPKAQFRPDFFRSSLDPDIILVPQKPKSKAVAGMAPAIYRNLRADVAIDCPGNAWLIDRMGKVELAANLKATKAAGQKLALGGKIRSLQGSLQIEDRAFKVVRAFLTLPGVPGKPVLVDVKAIHKMETITLELLVSGTVTNPQIHMESLPPLPPADVLAYLVFGAPAATLTRDQYLALGAQQLGGLGGVSTQKLSEILGSTIPFLSGLKLKSGMVSGHPTVGVEKAVTNNVSVYVGRNLDPERGTYQQQVGLEYKFNKNISVESQLGTRNSGADVFFNYDF